MPVYSAYFMLFMLASIGLPGLSGFVGEFLVALGTWEYNPWAALFTFAVVIFAAWYMMWMFQRIVFGRAPGEAPDPHDGELTTEEREELATLAAHGDHGHGAWPRPCRPAAGLRRLPRPRRGRPRHAPCGHDDHGGLTPGHGPDPQGGADALPARRR